ncbi:MAG: hypothetical protein HUU38_20995 [Anaerolineales bacterium]|nr:hypothetical protein [Anaerolineales bacterium]
MDVQTAVRQLITRLQETGKVTGMAPDRISRSQLSELIDTLTKPEQASSPVRAPQPKTSSIPATVEITLTTRATRDKNEPLLLTPTMLARNVAPYLNAITSVQNVLNEVKGLPLRKIPILEIRTQPDLIVRLDGEASEAIYVIKGIVNTWRQRNDEQINRYSTGNLTNRVEKTTLERSKVEMASQMLDLVKAGMSEKEKFNYLSQLIPSIDVLIYSEFEIK